MKRRSHAPRPAPHAPDLLLEIGTEELPAAYLQDAVAQLRQDARRIVQEAHLEFRDLETCATPRRLLVRVRALNATQHNPPEEIRGPSKQAAFGPDGKPTGALQGFLRAKGGARSQIKIVSGERGEYVYLLKAAHQRPTKLILPSLLVKLIDGVPFPKTMRWDESGLRFARPVRWVLALYGTTPIRLKVGALSSGSSTTIGGPVRPRTVAVRHAAQYAGIVTRDGVILDQRQRRQMVEALVRRAAKAQQGQPVPEMVAHGLLDEVTGLVERPTSLVGRFDATYLQLPREVLLASMAKHQRVFAVQSSSGKLLPAFVAILDGAPRKPAAIRAVMERILNARLADAKLFWGQDCQRSLTAMAAQVSGVTFHETLGCMAEKQQRLHQLSAALERMWSLSPAHLRYLRRACELAKADLVSTMVKEFPTLQGIMGKYYATHQGESREVADAIEEQYLPLADRRPKTIEGSALSLLDKFDTLTSYFAINIEPTGDQDPFGLRRTAQGIVDIAWTVHRSLQVNQLFRARAELPPFGKGPDPEAEKQRVGLRVKRYLLERLYTFAWPKPVPTRDIIDAVLASRPDDLVDAMERVVSLTRFNGNRTLLKAAKVIERTANILKGAKQIPQAEPDPSRFQDALEGKLWNLLSTRRGDIDALIAKQSYGEATTLYGEVFFEPLHEFFAKVMVNVEDPQIQQNRLALMRSINALYTDRVADLSKLAILEEGTV